MRRWMKILPTCSRLIGSRAHMSVAVAALVAATAMAADAPALSCFAPGQVPTAVIASCSAALDAGLAGRARALALTLRADAWRQGGDSLKARADLDAAL